jgi:hypothetical protein
MVQAKRQTVRISSGHLVKGHESSISALTDCVCYGSV